MNKKQLFFNRADEESIETMTNSFRKGEFVIYNKTKYLFLSSVKNIEYSQDIEDAAIFTSKPFAELEIARCKLLNHIILEICE